MAEADFSANLKDSIQDIIDMQIPYPEKGKHSEIFFTFRDYFPPEETDFCFPPTPFDCMPTPFDTVPSLLRYKEQIRNNPFSICKIKCPISKMIIDYDLKILDKSSFTSEQPVTEMNLECLEYLKKRSHLKQLQYDLKQEDNRECSSTLDSINSPLKIWSLKLRGKDDLPISILQDIECRLGPNSEFMPPTAVHKCIKDDILQCTKTIDTEQFDKELKNKNIPFEYIIYYLTNGLWKAGYIYWIVEAGDQIYMYDLTTSFQMAPFVIKKDKTLSKDERSNIAVKTATKNAVGLLYYHTAKQYYMFDKNQHYHEIIDMCDHAIELIDKKANLMEYCMACIIKDKTIIPDNTESENPLCRVVSKEGQVKHIRTNPLKSETEATLATLMTLRLKQTIKVLEDCLIVLAKRLGDESILPVVEDDLASPKHEHDVVKLVKEFGNKKVKYPSVHSLKKSVMDTFMKTHENNLKFRVLVYLLRKLYLELIISARLDQKQNKFGSAIHFAKQSLSVWFVMGSLLRPKKSHPLPLMPLFLMGEIFYSYSLDENYARNESRKFNFIDIPPLTRKILPLITAVTNDRRCILDYPDPETDCSFAFVKLSLECYSRAILFTDVQPTTELLERVCHVMNDLSYTYMLRCYDANETFQSYVDADRVLDKVNEFITVTKALAMEMKDDKILAMAYCNQGRYLQICYFFNDFLKFGKHLICSVNEKYNRAFAHYETAISHAKSHTTWNQASINIIVEEYTKALYQYCIRYREAEFTDCKLYTREILKKYEKILILSLEFQNTSPYFAYRQAYATALIGEYLHGLHIDTDLLVLRDAFIMWYNEAITRFNRLTFQKTPIEQLKLIMDLVNFYEIKSLDMKESSIEFRDNYRKILKLLLQCQSPLAGLYTLSWFTSKIPSEVLTPKVARKSLVGVFIHLFERKLQFAFKKRLQLLISCDIIIDLPKVEVRDLYQLTLRKEDTPVLDYLLDIMPTIVKRYNHCMLNNMNLE